MIAPKPSLPPGPAFTFFSEGWHSAWAHVAQVCVVRSPKRMRVDPVVGRAYRPKKVLACLAWHGSLSVAVINAIIESKLVEKKIYCTGYNPSLREIKAGAWSRSHGGMLLTGPNPLSLWHLFR